LLITKPIVNVNEVDFRTSVECSLPIRGTAMEKWNFVVFGCDSQNRPSVLGKADNYEHALKLQASGISLGWSRVRIFDKDLQEAQWGPKPPT